MAKDNITLYIRAKDLASGALARIKGGVSSFASGAKAAIAGAAKAAAVLGAALGAVAKISVSDWLKQATAVAKLEATLKATGYASGLTATELKKQAAELQTLTGVGDETIISMQGILATFKNVRGNEFKDATVAVLDMSAAMGKAGASSSDIETKVLQVGKALNDPINGMSALTRVGVTFTDEQKRQVQALQESGDMMGAQRIILAELQTEFGGTAAAMSSANHGLDLLKATFGDMREEVGRVITETDGFDGIIKQLTESIKNLTESGMIEYWAENVRAALNDISPAVGKVRQAFSWMKEKIAGAAAFYGALSAGANANDAIDSMTTIPKAVEQEKQQKLAAIRERKAKAETAKLAEEQAKADAGRAAAEAADAQALSSAKERQLEIENKKAEIAKNAADKESNIAELDAKIEKAKDKLAKAEERRANATTTNINKWIGDLQAKRDEKTNDEKDLQKAQKKAANLRRKIAAGTQLNKNDRQWLADFDTNMALRQPGRVQNAADKLETEKEARKEYEKLMEKIQKDQLAELKKISQGLIDNATLQ